eukprot:CAMPEP_0115511796 /NCGR_PEP_ID=MMETSP0271-20121206/74160_1 /TAXON_ID=71861 /ORGANISM="Scrippsiella trochoidea, Strain CCMP3099" /LENGTH=164 /DNA_ID=CAMNT_0002941897 /DNA_START=21 /DNA_END=515 /DNA_ORIENTATION=+
MAPTLTAVTAIAAPQRRGSKILSLVLALVAAWLFVCDLVLPQQTNFNQVACADDTGCRKMKIFSICHKSKFVTYRHATILEPGSMVKVSAKTGPGKTKVFTAIVVSTAQNTATPAKAGFFMAGDLSRAILCDKEGNPLGKNIRGAVDIKCAMRWPRIAELAAKR